MYVNQNFKYSLSQDLFSSDDVGSWEGPNAAMPNCVLCSVSTRKLRLGTRLSSALLQGPVISISAGLFPHYMSFTRQRLV